MLTFEVKLAFIFLHLILAIILTSLSLLHFQFPTYNELYHLFQGDNFDENYQRINKTYFSEGINVEEERPYEPYTYTQVCN